MAPVNTMVSSTPCCKNYPPEPRPARRRFAGAGLARSAPARAIAPLLLAALLWLGLALAGAAAARAQGVQGISGLRLEQGEGSVYLSAALQFELPALVEDALYKGIPMYFVLEADIARERWYWYDEQIVQATRHLRLSYQPLTRRWRLNTAALPFEKTGLGVVLGQSYDALEEALEALQRVARWKVAEAQALDVGAHYSVQLGFRLDLSQLPRPLQIGALGRSGWSLALQQRQRVALEAWP